MGSAGESLGVNVLNEGKIVLTVPYSDAAAQDALYNSSVKGAHSRSRGSGLSQIVEEVETLLTSTDQ